MEPVFALDIGTRMVMGLIMTRNGDVYEILASASTEHRQRAMYDGQVHDVDEVARAVHYVKDELEKKLGIELKGVAVAAAGRALKTMTASAERKEVLPFYWEREDVFALEMEAIQEALRNLGVSETDAGSLYHCVGYNVIEQYLENQKIGNLTGQRGSSAKVNVIATFLPRTVVDGLVAVLGRTGMEMTSITLEPIAAGQAAIPVSMRRLNLALVDIGAGTADIALTKEGAFFAYGMVAMAGDEVTESICSQYLVDFQVGESIKRQLDKKKKIVFHDFLGNKVTVTKEDILKVIEPIVDELAKKIAAEILRLNGHAPEAVILVGGGSKTPMLPDRLAEALNMPRTRVGLQIRERLEGVKGEKGVMGPESITPIGIGMSAIEGNVLKYYNVQVNETTVPIFELQLATVADALMAAGIQPRALIGKPGLALTYEFNGEVRVIRGKMGSPAKLFVNGQPAKVDQRLEPEDKIEFEPANPGEDASATLDEVLPSSDPKVIILNGEKYEFLPQVLVDGQTTERSASLQDGAKITYIPNEGIYDLLRHLGYQSLRKELNVVINGQRMVFENQILVKVNDVLVTEDLLIRDGDSIIIKEAGVTVKELGVSPNPLIFYVNGQEIKYPPQGCYVWARGKELSPDDQLQDGMELRVEGFRSMPILSDVLPFVTLPEQGSTGKMLKLSVNGQPAEFTTSLYPGDRIEIKWV